ncbi:MAG: PAAR domain-containing protein [Spongiibacteraceae bacterium]|nr:PAAR domain-containing protein [Spongiibacteraceae bacterium]MBN4055274.1 PAAR domain-containing protein [bacterium AH-315-K03]
MGKLAARLGDMHVCPKVEPGPVPHVGGPIAQGSPNVLIGGIPAARVGDMAVCIGPPDKVSAGSATVMINGKAAARMGDSCGHGGKIILGCPTVFIGDGGGSGGGGGKSAAAPAASQASSDDHLPKPPQTKEEALERMEQATKKVQEQRAANQTLPQSPYSTADKLKVVDEGLNETFIVRITKTQYASDTDGIGKATGGATSYWTTTFTQLEHADTDAELIAKAVGTDYDPKESYTLLLIDQKEAAAQGDMVSFIPTYKNLGDFADKELSDEFEGNEHLIEPSMSPEYSEAYEQVISIAKDEGVDLNDKDEFNDFTSELGFDKDQRSLLRVRHTMYKNLGANEQFLGNGMTKDNNAANITTPFGESQISQSYGPVETFTYDKNPQTLAQLETDGIVTRIPLNNA